jgi:hypothetical protein
MTAKSMVVAAVFVALVVFSSVGCDRDTTGLDPAPFETEAIVFTDNFGNSMEFQAFLGSKLNALDIDTEEKAYGTAALRVTVPAPGDPNASYAGGAFTTNIYRDLSGYNAVTFYARASIEANIDVIGFGNDNTGASLYDASWKQVPVTTEWQRYVVPIPSPAKLVGERGLFYFAEGAENGQGYFIWFDEIMFEKVPGISNPRPRMASKTSSAFVGAQVAVEGSSVTFDVNGDDIRVEHMPSYFDFTSTDPDVAFFANGVVQVVGGGSATITAKLDTTDVTGSLSFSVTAPPSVAAPTPTHPANDVISIFSNFYTNRPVDKWSADWDAADVTDIRIAGDDVKAYTNLQFAGIEFTTETIDVETPGMTHFHMDVWVSGGSNFLKIKLVDFGADGVYGGAPDLEHELTFTDATTPAIVQDTWISFDIPLSDFTRLLTREHLAQLIISGTDNTVYVDNIYFYK